MKKLSILMLLVFVGFVANAQVADTDKTDALIKDINKEKNNDLKEGWNKNGVLNIGLNQGTLQNWAAGGERYSLAVNGVFNGYATKLMGNKIWENTLDMYYGLNYVSSTDFVPKKIDDRIDFSSRYGIKPMSWSNKNILKHTYLMGLVRAQTQFTKGYNYENPAWQSENGSQGISDLFSPLYTTFALGADYRPSKNFSVFFSPAAARLIFANSVYTSLKPEGQFGIDQGETMAFEFGAYLSARYNTKISENLDYRTRLDLYSNYLNNPQNVDILWDNFFAFKLGKYIGAGLGVTMVYDHDVPGQLTDDTNGDGTPDNYGSLGWVQLKQVLNLGFNYKF